MSEVRHNPSGGAEDLYVASRFLMPLAIGLQRLGLHLPAVAKEAGLDIHTATSTKDSVDYRVTFRLAERAYGRYGERLPFDLASLYEPGMFGAVDFLGQTSRTLGEAMAYVRAYEPANQNVVSMDVQARRDLVSVTQRYHCAEAPPRCIREGLLAFLVSIARKLTGRMLPLKGVFFAHEPPQDGHIHAEFFGVEPTWRAPHDELLFEAWILEVPMLRADPAIASILEGHVRELVSSFRDSGGLSRRVRQAIAELLPSCRATAGDVAAALSVSVRSLQRGLAFEGTSFAHLSKEVRRNLAMRMLRDPSIPVERVVERAGFRDRSAFNRAFKQWTGDTPSRFRKSRCEDSSGVVDQ